MQLFDVLRYFLPGGAMVCLVILGVSIWKRRAERDSLPRVIALEKKLSKAYIEALMRGENPPYPVRPRRPPLPQRSTAAAENMEKQLQLAGRVFGVNVERPFSREGEYERCGSILRDIQIDRGHSFSFNAETGQFRTYTYSYGWNVPEGLTPKDGISREKALEIARQVLADLDIKVPLNEDSMFYMHTHGPDRLSGAFWSVNGTPSYEGIPYFGSRLLINIRAYSGEVDQCIYYPIDKPPTSMDIKITSEEAAQKACEYLTRYWDTRKNETQTSSPTSSGSSVSRSGGENRNAVFSSSVFRSAEEPRKIIAMANDRWTSKGGKGSVLSGPARLCWFVTVVPERDGTRYMEMRNFVLVDAATGEVCGGA